MSASTPRRARRKRRERRAAASGHPAPAPQPAAGWSVLSPDSEPVRRLVAEVIRDARLGLPDPVTGTSAPAAFEHANATFAEAVENARRTALADCAADVAFIVEHAEEVRELDRRKRTSTGLGPAGDLDVGTERTARLRAEFARRLGQLGAREEQHRADLAELRHAAEATTALLRSAWTAKHPHPNHLEHFTVPVFELPADAAEIGQRAVAAAIHPPD